MVNRTGRGRAAGARGNPALTLLAVAFGVIMVALDGTIVAVANPTIQAQLHASLAQIQWVTNGYLLALAVTLITIGKFGDRFGHRIVFLIGIVGFGATSAAVGLSGDIAHSIALVIAFRVAEGVFGAMLQPTALALLRTTFSAEKLSRALGVWGAAIGAATAAGPIVGGLLVQHVNWESIFYINVPVGVVALVIGAIVLKETKPSKQAGSFDVLGTLLLSAALFLLIWGLVKGSGYGWDSARTLGFFGGAALAFALFIVCEWRVREPLLPLRLFRSVPLSAGTVLVLALMFALFGAMFFMTFYLENVRGLDAVSAGVRLLPLTAMLIVGSPIAGALISKIGPRFPMVAGMLLAAAGLFGLSRVGVASGLNDTIAWFILLGLGLSPVIVGTTEVIVGNAARELAGVAGGLQSTAMQVGGTLGTAILGAVLAARVSHLLPGRLAAAHLPHLTAGQLAQLKSAVDVGVAPVRSGTPPRIAALLTTISHTTFVRGMTEAFVVAGVVAVVGAAVGLLTRQGWSTDGEIPAVAGVAAASVTEHAPTGGPASAGPPAGELAGRRDADGRSPAAHPAGIGTADRHWSEAGTAPPPREDVLAGVVRGSGGVPLGAVSVTIVDGTGAQVAREVTAADGRYRIRQVPPGVYTALVVAPRHRPVVRMVTLDRPGTVSDFTVVGMGAVSGVVRQARPDAFGRGSPDERAHLPAGTRAERPATAAPNGGGAPLHGVDVLLTGVDGTVAARTVTGPDGDYRFGDMPEGDYTVTARTARHAEAAAAATVTAGAHVRADVLLAGTATLSGTVRQVVGDPEMTNAMAHAALAGVVVTVADVAGRAVARAVTAADGRYSFSDLAEGSYTVVATGVAPTATGLTLVAGQHLDLDVVLGRGGG